MTNKDKRDTIIILVICLLACFAGKAQTKWYAPTKNDWLSYGSMTLSGIAKGYNQAIVFHHYGRGKQFWDNSISWQNKYKNWPVDQSEAYLGSKTVLVAFSDGQHLTEALNTTFLIGGTMLLSWNAKDELKQLPKNQRIWAFIFRKVFIPTLIRGIAFEVTYQHL